MRPRADPSCGRPGPGRAQVRIGSACRRRERQPSLHTHVDAISREQGTKGPARRSRRAGPGRSLGRDQPGQLRRAGSRPSAKPRCGIGGSGKTRLALELAERLRRLGWYAGILPRGTADIDWLGRVVSPVLVIVDYADGRVDDVTALLSAVRGRRRPAVVVLTARSTEGDWLPEVETALDDDRHAHRVEDVELPDKHPRPREVFHGTMTAVADLTAGSAPSMPPVPMSIRWTTLDLVLLGWIAALGGALPTSRGGLYDEALRHEQNYWAKVYPEFDTTAKPDRALLRRAAACLT